MRNKLKPLLGQRMLFTAKVSGFGVRHFKDKEIATILLSDIRDAKTTKPLTDHLWFTKGKCWSNLNIGQSIEFEARVKQYEKGYKGQRVEAIESAPTTMDYKLERPSKIKCLA